MDARSKLISAACDADFGRVDDLLRDGADLNAVDAYGESVLAAVVSEMICDRRTDSAGVAAALLARGADPTVLDSERGGPLQAAMLGMDTDTLRVLLDAGADPNAEAGFSEAETLLDWAESDYQYEVFGFKLPEEPSENDTLNTDAWLAFLDRVAEKHGVRRPDHLLLLRSRGAKMRHEIAP